MDEILRFWEPPSLFVVVGYANRVQREVKVEACRHSGVPILRRCTGGGTVLQGPGCLNYTLIFRIDPAVATVPATNRHVMTRQKNAIEAILQKPVAIHGFTDLALDDRKFSGNAQRRRRSVLIFHGTFLLGVDPAQMEQFLEMPSQQPGYRAQRSHRDFLTNLDLSASQVKEALKKEWHVGAVLSSELHPPAALVGKYESDDWNFKF